MARRRGKTNVKNQVDQALKKINYIGQSKKAFRDNNKPTGLHSTNQIKETYSVSMNFVAWAKEQHGLKDIYQLKRSHYRDYIQYKSQSVSNGHLINIETSLKILAKGMNQLSKEKGMKNRDWAPKQRLVHSRDREKAEDRSYTKQEIHSMRENLSKNARVGLDLQVAFGLRLREASNARVAHIIEKDGKLYFRAVKEKEPLNTAKGVTKAGRPRTTPCRPEYETRIRELITGKENRQYISPIKYNSLKSAYLRGSKKANIENYTGSHGFRHSYAREQLGAKLQERGIYSQGRAIIQRMIANYDRKVRKDTGVLRTEIGLYKAVNQCIDQVHQDLGHGKGRMDLVAIYMR